MNKKISLGVAIAALILAVALTASATVMITLKSFRSVVHDASKQDSMYEKLDEIEGMVEDYFHGEIDQQSVTDAAAAGYIAGLGDKYSTYLTAEQYAAKKQNNSGVRVGIGVTFMLDEDGYALVTALTEGGTAKETGILTDDRITAVDGVSVVGKTLTDIREMVTGKEDTEVVLFLLRGDAAMEYTVLRKSFDLQTVSYEMMDRIGYISIDSFNAKTAEQFKTALDAVLEQDAVGLIFDLRGNGGGILNAAFDCLDLLVGQGELAVAVNDKGEERVLSRSDANEVDLPMVVLQNASTASAAELFSATLRDYGKASVVGTVSYGKGVMQTTYELSDGSAITITTAKLLTHSRNEFHGIGVAPTYEVTLTKEQEDMVLLGSHEDDPQLAKAIEILDIAN